MAKEARRGCGFRKIGGLYLVSDPGGIPCDRLPILLTICPTCSCGIKQTRGWTWVDVAALVGGDHQDCFDLFGDGAVVCPLCVNTKELGRAGLLWIGTQFYKTPLDYEREAQAMGCSRRIKAVPREFKIGETWVLLAHPKTIEETCHNCVGSGLDPDWATKDQPKNGCQECDGTGKRVTPGIFKLWRPQRVEKILPESQRNSEEIADLEKRGITPVFVDDNDPDHQGSVYDKEEVE